MMKYRLEFVNLNYPDDSKCFLEFNDLKYIIIRLLEFGFDTFDKELNDKFGYFPIYHKICIYHIFDSKYINFMFILDEQFDLFCSFAGFLLEVLNEKK